VTSIALIDYGAGNLTSVKKALAAIGAPVFVPRSPGEIAEVTGVIVPGVGHFGATRALDSSWVAAILQHIGEGRPLLGICLGMQWLFEGSEEAPECPGLGVLSGQCHRLQTPAGNGRIKVPHVGWNSLDLRQHGSIVDGVAPGTQMYFTHSYVAPLTGDTISATEHGETFASVVQRGQIAGVQFHPEKSGDAGLRILKNFVERA
jgi:imidazole glycerol-phosphate synthase subunit HisH